MRLQIVILMLTLLALAVAQSNANKKKTPPPAKPKASTPPAKPKEPTPPAQPQKSAASNTRGLKSPNGQFPDQSAAPSNYGSGPGSSSSGASSSQGPAPRHRRRHRQHPRPGTAAPPGYNQHYRRRDGRVVPLRRMRIPDTIPENPPPAGIPSALQAKLRQEGWQIPANGNPIPPPNFQLPGNGGSSGAGSSQGASSSGSSQGISAPSPNVGTNAAGSSSGAGSSRGTSPVGSSSGMPLRVRAQLQREGWTFPENGMPIPPPNLFSDRTELRRMD
ncbi:hypothetical protein MIR68_002409 [Amoeboaphelidium protococcarum]|nr:hypothetical protein MIR68_002409 [Amoeboaphelidium protococcarum]